MGKYQARNMPPPPRPYEIHPIWRGLGCLMVLIGPPVALAAGHLLVEMNSEAGWVRVPREVMNRFTLPGIGYTVPHFYATLIVAAILMLLSVGLLMIVYAIMYSFLGPKRYGPLDSPPVYSTKARRKR